MARRIYRPVSPSWREANADSANDTISTMLATYATDIKNRRLKRAVTSAQNAYNLATQGATAYVRPLQKGAAYLDRQKRDLARQAQDLTDMGNRLQAKAAVIAPLGRTVAEQRKRLDWFQKKAKADASFVTQQRAAEYQTLRNSYLANLKVYQPKYEDYQRDQTVYEAARRDLQAANRQSQSAYRDIQRTQHQYDRATARSKRAYQAYKNAVNDYNAGYYPV